MAISGFGGVVKTTLTARFAKSPVFTYAFVPASGFKTETMSAFFADKIEKLSGQGLDAVVAIVMPKTDLTTLAKPANKALHHGIQTGAYASFGDQINAAIDEEILLATEEFNVLFDSIKINRTFGRTSELREEDNGVQRCPPMSSRRWVSS